MPSKAIIMPKPNTKQDIALREEHRYVGYGGARGGGKSWFVRWKAVLLCLRYPGIKVMIIRKTYPELQENPCIMVVQTTFNQGVWKKCEEKAKKLFFWAK